MTKENLKNYILRALGSPKINIELDDFQIEDRINDAIQYFTEYHYDGTNFSVIVLQLQDGVKNYTLPNNVISVIKVFNDLMPTSDTLLMRPLSFWNLTDFEVNFNSTSYITFMQSMSLFQSIIGKEIVFDFNGTTKQFYLFSDTQETLNIGLLSYVAPENTNTVNVYDNRWIKQYAISLAGLQWATNISKYGNIALPGGGQINYTEIEQRYTQMKQDLEQQLFDQYTESPAFFFG